MPAHASSSHLPALQSDGYEGHDDHDDDERSKTTLSDGRVDHDGNGIGDAEYGHVVPGGHARVHLASVAEKKALWWRNVAVTGMFILSWYGFATLLSLYNKWMFSPEYYGFGFPLFVTFCHMIVQFTLAAIIRRVWPQYRPAERPKRKDYAAKVFPTAVCTGLDIGLSNLSLKTITLSLYTMCKSSALIFVLFFAFLFHLETYSLRLVLVIALISFGVFLMVFNTTAVSIPGIIMVFSASGIGGLRWALTELLMHKREMGMSNPFATIFWLAPLMAVTLGFVSVVIEDWHALFSSEFFAGLAALHTVGIIALPGAIAFAMVASEYFIIQRAGIVPLSIAGIFKEVTTITISAWVFGDQLTELNIVGVVVTVSGIALFSYHKYQKSLATDVALDKHGRPVGGGGDAANDMSPLLTDPGHRYAPAATDDDEHAGSPALPMSPTASRSYPLRSLDGAAGVPPIVVHAASPRAVKTERAPSDAAHRRGSQTRPGETEAERTDRLRDEFEGWGDDDGLVEEAEDDEDEVDEDEVERRRAERDGAAARSWNQWWDRAM